jgi:hypothetical protein
MKSYGHLFPESHPPPDMIWLRLWAALQRQYKAIFVDGNAVRKAAKKPENKASDIKTPVEFPF